MAITNRDQITQRELKSLLHYDPDTGAWTWLPRVETSNGVKGWNVRFAGKTAGRIWVDYKDEQRKYLQIPIFRREYLAHRLAWLYMTGEWPKQQIDHVDCDGTNCKWLNLREASHSQNQCNQRARRGRPAGSLKGVGISSAAIKNGCKNIWRARISKDGKQQSLGLFASREEAHAAYVNAAKALHGEFARGA